MKGIILGFSILFVLCFCEDKSNIDKTMEEELDDSVDEKEKPKKLKDSISYLALGDSYTIGESVIELGRWPVQLVQRLIDSGHVVKTPRIIAKTGWTTDELKGAINDENISKTYDFVSLLIGVNNQYREYPVEQQEKEFEELLQMAINFAGKDTSRVFVVSIPDYGVTPFGQNGDPEKIASEIDLYNEINLKISKKYKVRYFNITPISREAANDSDLIANDGLHPSGLMYRKWVDLIFPWVRHELRP